MCNETLISTEVWDSPSQPSPHKSEIESSEGRSFNRRIRIRKHTEGRKGGQSQTFDIESDESLRVTFVNNDGTERRYQLSVSPNRKGLLFGLLND